MRTGPLRILHLLASPAWSGPAENVALLALAQREAGHTVHVAADTKRPRPPNEEPIVPRLSALGLLDGGGLELSVKSSPLGVLRDVRALRSRSLDVVHAHFTHDHLIARFGVPRGAILVRTLHAPRSLRRTLPRADAFTVSTPDLEQALLRQRAARTQVVGALRDPAFVPSEDRDALRASLGITGAPLVGMVSNLQPSRRHALGLAAFARLPTSARMVIVGEGPLEGALRAQVSSLGLGDRVTFCGYQQGPDFIRWLQALDEVWLLGLGNDWTGRAAVQARACGVRVVAVEEGGLGTHADSVVHALDPDEVARASLQAQRTVSQRLPDNRAIAAQVESLYREARAALRLPAGGAR